MENYATIIKMLYSPKRFPKWQGGVTNPKEPKYYAPYTENIERFKIYLNSHEYFRYLEAKRAIRRITVVSSTINLLKTR